MSKMYSLALTAFVAVTTAQIPDISDIEIADFSDSFWSILSLVDPEMLFCTENDWAICNATGFMECNEDIGICQVPCDTSDDCKLLNVTGTGLEVCSEGFCYPNLNGSCSEDDDCPSLLGFSCNVANGSCQDPVSCDSDDDCTTDGLMMCSDGLCGVEYCNSTADCISSDYVCQSQLFCVPDCNDFGCDDVGLICGSDGLCYQGEQCDDDSDCEDFTNTCFQNVTGMLDADGLPITSSLCGTTCSSDADCEDLGIPWGVCLMNTTCVTQPHSSVLTNLTRWSEPCNSTADCSWPSPWCVTLNEAVGSVCVPNDTALISNITGLSMCSSDDDCSSEAPVCLNESTVFVGYGYCVPACYDDDDCAAMGIEDGWCQGTDELGAELPYKTCLTFDPCDALGQSNECGDSHVCVNSLCLGTCDTDDDCSEDVECSTVTQDIPFIGENELFSFCDVFSTESTTTTTEESGDAEATEYDGDGDGAGSFVVFGSILTAFSAFLL